MILLDTHALVWWVAEPEKLSRRARQAVLSAEAERELAVSAMSLIEIATLLRRGRIELTVHADRWLDALRSLPELTIEPITAEIAWAAGQWDADFPGDPADRIIAATARSLDARLVTADERLQKALAGIALW